MGLPHKWGLPGILEALRVIVRLDKTFRPVIVSVLSADERGRYLLIMEAIKAFLELGPFPGEGPEQA